MASDHESSVLSDCSSPLSDLTVLSRSPSPLSAIPVLQQATPPSSQTSSDAGSPCPEDMDSTINARGHDGPPPSKRRRFEKPRTTEYLDLRSPTLDPSQQEQLDRLVSVLKGHKKIVVVAGAGISVSAGIPDFRSSTGLFTSLRAEHNLKGSGKHLFDASVYKDNSSTSSFHDMVRNLHKLTKNASATPFHQMLASLSANDRLLRLYTQNVDGIDTALPPLETTVPLTKGVNGKWPKSVQLHGGLDKMVCSKCGELSAFDADLFDGPDPPICGNCVELDRLRTDVAGKRSHGIGRLRPRMVLYNEHNPDEEAIGRVVQDDLRKRPDAIIVVGTSLKIPGVRRIVKEMCGVVRNRRNGLAVWINHDPEPTGVEFKDCWDIVVRGTSDEVARRAGLRSWFEQDESVEMTEDDWNFHASQDDHIVVNTTYKSIDSKTQYRKPPTNSPDYSPITNRTLLLDGADSDRTNLEAPPTPSKSVRSSPSKKRPSDDALAGLGQKLVAKKRKQQQEKISSSKSSSAPRAKAKRGPRKPAQSTKLTQTMKSTKAFANKSVKPIKSPKKAAIMSPVRLQNARVNGPSVKGMSTPTKRCGPLFPGLSPDKAQGQNDQQASLDIKARMSLERVMSPP